MFTKYSQPAFRLSIQVKIHNLYRRVIVFVASRCCDLFDAFSLASIVLILGNIHRSSRNVDFYGTFFRANIFPWLSSVCALHEQMISLFLFHYQTIANARYTTTSRFPFSIPFLSLLPIPADSS